MKPKVNTDSPFKQVLKKPRMPQLDSDRTALVIVDMQYFDAHPDWGEGKTAKDLGVAHYFDPYFEQLEEIIPNIQHLLHLFRDKKIEVIHIRVSELTTDSRDVSTKQLVRGLIVPSDSKEAEFLERVAPIEDEIIFNKSSSGVFPVTNFDRILRNLNITTLVFTGTSTGGCVESAVRDATDLGYDVIVVDDACASSTRESHLEAIERMNSGLTHIMTTSALEAAVNSLPSGNPLQRSGVERVKAFLPKPPEQSSSATPEPYDLIFPPALTLKPTKDDTALVLVDTQRLTCDSHVGLGALASQNQDHQSVTDYYERVTSSLQKAQQLLTAARKSEIPVVYVRTAGRRSDGLDLSRKLREQGIVVAEGSIEAEIVPELSPESNEIVLSKPASGIFTGTGLDEILRNLGIRTLILAGISFDGAIEGSLRSASDRGYQILLVPDACACATKLLQNKLWKMQSGLISVTETSSLTSQLLDLTSEATAT